MKNGHYEFVKPPDDYPGLRYRGRYVYEHHLVWWQNTGELVPTKADFLIHHKDENKRNNAFSNLEKKTRSDHGKEHGAERAVPRVQLVCGWCGKTFGRRQRDIAWRLKAGQQHFSCCSSHATKLQYNGPRHPPVAPREIAAP